MASGSIRKKSLNLCISVLSAECRHRDVCVSEGRRKREADKQAETERERELFQLLLYGYQSGANFNILAITSWCLWHYNARPGPGLVDDRHCLNASVLGSSLSQRICFFLLLFQPWCMRACRCYCCCCHCGCSLHAELHVMAAPTLRLLLLRRTPIKRFVFTCPSLVARRTRSLSALHGMWCACVNKIIPTPIILKNQGRGPRGWARPPRRCAALPPVRRGRRGLRARKAPPQPPSAAAHPGVRQAPGGRGGLGRHVRLPQACFVCWHRPR